MRTASQTLRFTAVLLACALVGGLNVGLAETKPAATRPVDGKPARARPARTRPAATQPVGTIVVRECLVVNARSKKSRSRSAIRFDPVIAMIVNGRWSAPKAGDKITVDGDSQRAWTPAAGDANGVLKHAALRGGYAYASVEADATRVMLLDAAYHGMIYVNSVPRVGNPYGKRGKIDVPIPVLLRKGANDLLLACGRGVVRLPKLTRPKSAALFAVGDTTLPDLIVGEKTETWGSIVVINATTRPTEGLFIRATGENIDETIIDLPAIPTASLRKVGFHLTGPSPVKEGECNVRLELMRRDPRRAYAWRTYLLDEAVVKLRIRRADQTHKRTFISEIDGSVQYYAVSPAKPLAGSKQRPALVLTAHGASCEALGQVGCYSPKTWCHVVAPTNRRPFGFDWEDWGRLDAMEVLDLAVKRLKTDPQRTYLTGHSMGGHGVWHLGTTFPDRFAALGPSAGWISFWTYGGGARYADPTAIERILIRAVAQSKPRPLLANCARQGVYVLHGSNDNEVPVNQARHMIRQLSRFHGDFVYREQPGVKHWWNIADTPGTDCVDWAPMFDFFARRRIPTGDGIGLVNFVTANPGISARCHWATIEAQTRQHEISSVKIRFDSEKRRFVGTTKNVARLSLGLEHVPGHEAIGVELDGEKIAGIAFPKKARRVWLGRRDGKWAVIARPALSLKGPHRYGLFKDAFRRRVMFVYGTSGTPAENAWAGAKARYDAETFWYRGNASVDIVPDKHFNAAKTTDRNVILYGNADTNAAWKTLLAGSPVQVGHGSVRVGKRKLAGDDLACLFIRPRPGSDTACVGVVAGSGHVGMCLTDRLPIFVSGVGYPDCIVIGSDMLTRGTAGVRAAGFFGLDWSVESGDFAWQEKGD